ncbi:MAG: hypothetical protein HY313_08125 [Acidobacteria bacterium]|nr:hypothetical protein [Acidobacteriota bacterium]
MALDERAICHEAGHAVAALHLGVHVERIEVTDRLPHSTISRDSLEKKSTEQRCIVLAGGIAGEKFFYGDYDKEASQGDQNRISEMGGDDIRKYLVEALKIVSLHEVCLRELKKQLISGWVRGESEASWESDCDSFELLSHEEIQCIWKGSCRERRV